MFPGKGGPGTAPILLVFGLLLGTYAGLDIWRFHNPGEYRRERRRWFFDHMTRMLGAVIATYTAVLVVNADFLIPVVRWLGPTAVGSVGITLWVRYYARRFAAGQRPHELVTIRIWGRNG